MRRALAPTAAALLAVLTLTASPAGAADPSCEAEAIRIAFEHPQVWAEAASPVVICGSTPATARVETAGYYDLPTNTIYLRDGLSGYSRMVAHELGHAWFFHQRDTRRVVRYARIRGFADP